MSLYLIVRGTPTEVALALNQHDIAVQDDLRTRPMMCGARVHECYRERVQAWLRESGGAEAPGTLVLISETEMEELW